MRFPKLVLFAAATAALAVPAWSQDSAQMAAQQAQVRAMLEQIARQRPVQAESAAREMVRRLQLEQQMLDSLRARSADQYWQEVAQLTVQAQMLRQMADSARQQLMAQMFGTEARARGLQRAYRETADSGQERAIRERLQVVLERHFAAEDSLRSLEIADVERRLAQVRTETARRRRDGGARHAQPCRQEPHQLGVRRALHGWGREPELHRVTVHAHDFGAAGPRHHVENELSHIPPPTSHAFSMVRS